MGEPVKFQLKIRHYELDDYGHVNHANYVHYLETARIEALEAVGLSLAELRRQGYFIFAADLFVRYVSPAGSGETLDIVTYIRDMRGARSVWIQEIRDAASQRLVVTAEVTGAFMSENGRPVRIPDAFREKLSVLYVPDASPARKRLPALSLSHEQSQSVADQSHVGEAHRRDRRPWCVCGARGVVHIFRGLRKRTGRRVRGVVRMPTARSKTS